MKTELHPLITAAELEAILGSANLIVVDAGSGGPAKEAYAKKHITGALYVDLNIDLSDTKEDAADGGRHPLPSVQAFGQTLSNLGISSESHVVVYDDKSGANAAARFWWMLRSVGHQKVQVLNGGLQAAEKHGFQINNIEVKPEALGPYPASDWQFPISTIDEVEGAARHRKSVVIDVREAFRYKGVSEPIDLIAGHIPGAVNIPLQENLDKNGLFLSPLALQEKYAAIMREYKATIHCGSGVTACHTILALASAGFEIPKLYVGSWSEWSRNDKPIAKAV
ncbi:MAG: thiosulfate/3-mercaptopyruvate sulfurtransferase [Cryomorphaceae bacterium]|jgi:thiosulfate/3-mercaptopyruvate sulfurtransferase